MKKILEILATLRKAARHLARGGRILCVLTSEALQRGLAALKRDAFHLRDASFSGEGLQDGVTAGSWERIRVRA